MEWIKESEHKPPFGERVLVYCRIYGRCLYTYEFIGEAFGEKWGNWHDGKNLGVLPPVYWCHIPEIPEE